MSKAIGDALVQTMYARSAVAEHLRALDADMRACVPGIIADRDPDCLHEYRVMLRRARSLLTAFKQLYDKSWYRRARRDLHWIGATTSPLRDLDVFLAALNEMIAGAGIPLDEAQGAVQIFVAAQRERELGRVRKLFELPRYLRFSAAWQDALDMLCADDAIDATAVAAVVGPAIRRRYKRLVRHIEALTSPASYADLHRVRKDCKRVRYLLDTFASLYAENIVKPIQGDLKHVQSVLGEICDRHAQMQFAHAGLQGTSASSALVNGLSRIKNELLLRSKQDSSPALIDALDKLGSAKAHAQFKCLWRESPA